MLLILGALRSLRDLRGLQTLRLPVCRTWPSEVPDDNQRKARSVAIMIGLALGGTLAEKTAMD